MRSSIIGLSIATGALGLTSLGLATMNWVNMSQSQAVQTELENVYQRNLFDLVEGVNNAEIKLSKAITSDDKDNQKKLLTEVVKNSRLAESAISSLPITQNSMADSVKFINQLGGYSTTVIENLASESRLSQEEKDNLEKLHNSLVKIKDRLNEYVDSIQKGKNIIKDDIKLVGEENTLTVQLSASKDVSVDYPSMIYDGPFSDSETNYVVRGLKGAVVNQTDAKNNVMKHFKNISSIDYAGEIKSNFETINFDLSTTEGHELFVQVSKIGGNILTVSGYQNGKVENEMSEEEAMKIALDFVRENGIENPQSVWQDSLNKEIYFNIAPVQNGIILYPDLVKVKVDLSTGTIIGYDATGYFINHVDRNLYGEFMGEENARKYVPKGFMTSVGRLVLAPLEYSREVVCYEFESEKDGRTYYFYINAVDGKLENILKVISDDQGAKLM
jgi:germination protein YpeB